MAESFVSIRERVARASAECELRELHSPSSRPYNTKKSPLAAQPYQQVSIPSNPLRRTVANRGHNQILSCPVPTPHELDTEVISTKPLRQCRQRVGEEEGEEEAEGGAGSSGARMRARMRVQSGTTIAAYNSTPLRLSALEVEGL